MRATDRMAELGAQDLVVIGLKAHQVAGVAADIRGLCGPSTVVVTAQNGIPWWYFFKTGGPYEGTVLESVDPGGVIAKNIDVDRVLGSIIYPAADIVSPGVIRHVEGDRISLGEVDNSDTERLRSTAKLLRDAGFKVRVSTDLRSEMWVKLWGNCTFNPISALTHATLVDICQFPPTRALAERMMREAQEIGEKLGVRFPVRWRSASPAPRRWGSTRPRCSRTWRPAGRWSSTRWWARCSSSAGSPVCRRRTSRRFTPVSRSWRRRSARRTDGSGSRPR